MEELNQNDLLKHLKSNTNDSIFAVNSIFDTIQGEGFLSGKPATFVRFNICHVGCSFCDTKYTWSRINKNQFYTIDDILDRVKSTSNQLIVLTGGEPLEQPNLPLLVEILLSENFEVQIETSGRISIEALTHFCKRSNFYLTVSPKGKAHASFKDCLISDLKILVDMQTTYSDIISVIDDYCEFINPLNISIQPIEELALDFTKRNSKRAVDLVKMFNTSKFSGIIRLSIQTHKIIEIE